MADTEGKHRVENTKHSNEGLIEKYLNKKKKQKKKKRWYQHTHTQVVSSRWTLEKGTMLVGIPEIWQTVF